MSKIDSGANDEIRESSRFIVFIWIVCRTMGLVPLKIKKCRENGITVWIASYSNGWAVYSWAFLLFTVSMNVFGTVILTMARTKQFPKVLLFMLIFNVVLMDISAFVGICRSQTHARRLIKARRLIEKAKSIISWSKNTTDCSSKYYNTIGIFFLHVWLLNLIMGFVSQLIGGIQTRRPMLYSTYFVSTHAVIYFMVLNFTNVINCMMHTIVQVNDTIKHIQKNVNKNSGGYGDLRTKLSSVIEARCLVGKAGSILSKDQSPVLLVMLLSIVSRSVVICNSFIFESSFQGREFFASFQLTCCIGEIIKLVCIVESCHDLKKMANETKEDITKLLMMVWDVDLRSDLKHCLRQINEHPIEFTAMHVWTIDRSLIGTVFGLVLTNLIVLIQFSN